MKPIILHTKHELPLKLEKISATVYYDSKSDQFYRTQKMPDCTTFVSEDVEKQCVFILTKFDPAFTMIDMLVKTRQVQIDHLPEYLQKRNWAQFSSPVDYKHLKIDKMKIFDFLERKVAVMEQYLMQHNPLDRLKLTSIEGKYISADTVTLLKHQLPEYFISEFIKERFDISSAKKMTPEVEEIEATKPKPLKKGSKKTPSSSQELGKNQPTLFSFAKKVEKKE